MAEETGFILGVLKFIKSVTYDVAEEYVGYIRSCDTNLDSLHTKLGDLRINKDEIDTKVKEGENRLERITLMASSWLRDVQLLVQNDELKKVAYKDWETAKLTAILMGKRNLKMCIRDDSDMGKAVIEVMKNLKQLEEPAVGETSDEERLREKANEDYQMLVDVTKEVMNDAIVEYRNRPRNSEQTAAMDRELDYLTKTRDEVEGILRDAEIARGANADNPNGEETAPARQGPAENLRNLMDNPTIKEAMPEIKYFKLALDVIDELWMSTNTDAANNRGCCHHTPTPCYFHDRYRISRAAESKADEIDNFISNRYPHSITLPIDPSELKPIPPTFLDGLDSRSELVHQILERLRNVEITRVGLFGMGGIGKTTLAKEVNKRADIELFGTKVMVEVSDASDTISIQAAIAESINLPLHDVTNVAQRATKLYNKLLSSLAKKRILIIFANIWKTINLDDIGIPNRCTLLLTTTDRGVCQDMFVQDANILEVGLLNRKEARVLFNSKTLIKVNDTEYENVTERLLIKCGGLPYAIVITANLLKDKNLRRWEQFADDLQKPFSSQVNSDYKQMYSVLNRSYKFIEVGEKRIFFLLACLPLPGSSMKIESLMRYGIGLNLFRYVNTLSEALRQANIWANELVLSTMLLEGDVVGEIKIHDRVRAFAISIAAKQEHHNFMVGPISYGLDNEPYKKFTGMSLMNVSDYRLLRGVQMNNLQILTLRGDWSTRLDNSFFEQMVNLEVLAMSNMNFQPSLPISIEKLEKLKTLCMEGCILGDIKQIGKLVNLIVLSLRESFVEKLPTEIESLGNLRLLDLTKCRSVKPVTLPAAVLNKLFKLEKLMFDIKNKPVESNSNDEGTSHPESNNLPILKALEVKVVNIDDLPITSVSIQNIDEFRVCIGSDDYKEVDGKLYRRSLYCYKINMETLENSPLKTLLRKADKLTLDRCTGELENLVPQLDTEGFSDLKFLSVNGTEVKFKYIVDPTSPPSKTLSNLQTLKLKNLKQLESVLPLALLPPNLSVIHVSSCESMKFMFSASVEKQPITLQSLRELKLDDLRYLESFLKGQDFLFDPTIEFPCLEVFHLKSCNVKYLWSEKFLKELKYLKNITIVECNQLLNIVKSGESTDTQEIQSSEQTIRFPQLEYLELRELSKFECFYAGGSKLEFPKLKTLKLYALECMTKFGKVSSSSAFFHEEIQFPCLEELEVRKVNGQVGKLWTSPAQSDGEGMAIPNPTPMLKSLTLDNTGVLSPIIPSEILMNLSSLGLSGFNNPPSVSVENWLKLEELTVEESEWEELFDEQFMNFLYGKLEKLVLRQLPNLRAVAVRLQLFNGLIDITIAGLNWIHVISADVLQVSLQQLQYLTIESCELIESVVTNTAVVVIQFPRLKRLKLMDLGSLRNISSSPQEQVDPTQVTLRLPLLEFLLIDNCPKLQHFWAGIIEAPKLRELTLTNCANMKQFLIGNPERVIQLPSLKVVNINSCYQMKFISSGPLTAPNLTEVKLEQCNEMQNFLPRNQRENGILELPFLVNVVIIGCPQLRLFSLSPLLTPNLTQMRYGDDELKQQFDNLNTFLEFLQRGRQ